MCKWEQIWHYHEWQCLSSKYDGTNIFNSLIPMVHLALGNDKPYTTQFNVVRKMCLLFHCWMKKNICGSVFEPGTRQSAVADLKN